MEKRDRFRLTIPAISLVFWVATASSFWIKWKHPVVISGEEIWLSVGLLTACFGLLIHAVLVHVLIFAGKALSNDVSMLFMAYIAYTPFIAALALPFAAAWFWGMVFAFIILGTEFLCPDWPQKIYRFLRKYLILAINKLKKKRLVRNE